MTAFLSRPESRKPLSRRQLAAAVAVVASAASVPSALPAAAEPAEILSSPPAAAVTPRIVDLGTLPGDSYSRALAVNDHDVVVGGSSGDWTPTRAFVWRAGRMTELVGLGGNTTAVDVNNRGDVVGVSSPPGDDDPHAVLWRGGRMTDLGALGGPAGSVAGINDAGVVVGTRVTETGGPQAFSWRRGVMTDLRAAGFDGTSAVDVDDRGTVAGEAFTDMTSRTVLWTRGAARVVEVPGGPTGINDRGDVVGLTASGGSFVRVHGTVSLVAPPAGWMFLQLQEINNRGEAVGHGDYGAYLWREGTLTRLPSLVGAAASAWDVNDRGTIVGTGTATPDGLNERAVMWTR
jgi:probable HAF family extracellular repeat protein